jgi:pimeloyl-ACP methyl ester carboxylesterase
MSQTGIRLADQGHYWVGPTYERRDEQTVVDGTQLYVEFQIPERQTRPHPIVLVHGGASQGLDWMGTPDGRPGWRTLLLQRGYAVYLVDRPGHGRSPRHPRETGVEEGTSLLAPSVEVLGELFAGAGNPAHTQWPGSGELDDPSLRQWLASQNQSPLDLADEHAVMSRRGAELLDRIGPAIVITSSAGGPAGWLMADARPHLVEAVVGLEPISPNGPLPLPWGLAASPLTYEPPTAEPGGLEFVELPGRNGSTLRLQTDPPRRLVSLAQIAIAIVSGEQSFANSFDEGTVDFLRQAGCEASHLRLGECGIHGNGHLMMLERNNEQVLDLVVGWLDEHTSAK